MLLALAMQIATPPVDPADEIVVIARKMRSMRINMKAPRRDGRLVLERCRVTRSSGDAEIDAVPCAVAQACSDEGVTTRKALDNCVITRSVAQARSIANARRAS